MYIPSWLLILIVIIVIFLLIKKDPNKKLLSSEKDDQEDGHHNDNPETIEAIEERIKRLKDSIFSLARFDSPKFIDLQNDFDVMEVNYFKLKQKNIHNNDKALKIARDWYRYAWALESLKDAHLYLDLLFTDEDKIKEKFREPAIVKEEIEKKFKLLLKNEFHELKPNFHKRLETMKGPDGKIRGKFGPPADNWRYYYRQDENLDRLERKREDKEQQTRLNK